MEIALPRCLTGARLVAKAIAVGIIIAEPKAAITRATIIHTNDDASAATPLPIANIASASIKVDRRLRRPISIPHSGAASAYTHANTVTKKPVCPSDTPSCCATCGNTAASMKPSAPITKAPSASTAILPHGVVDCCSIKPFLSSI